MKAQRVNRLRNPIPVTAGIGLRFPHLADFEAARPDLEWVEMHTENLFSLSPELRQRLLVLRADYQFSLHGVGMSLGSADGLDASHLAWVADEVKRYQPILVSEHLSWNRVGGVHLPDLLPLPLTQEALDVVVGNVTRAQDALQRIIAIENGSAYARWNQDEMQECEFLTELVKRTGCHLLVDINNLYVNQLNLGEDPHSFLAGIPAHAVAEMHLAGPTAAAGGWIDTHSTPVPEAVWQLYREALARLGATPSLIEWDQDLPPLDQLLAEAARADRALAARSADI